MTTFTQPKLLGAQTLQRSPSKLPIRIGSLKLPTQVPDERVGRVKIAPRLAKPSFRFRPHLR